MQQSQNVANSDVLQTKPTRSLRCDIPLAFLAAIEASESLDRRVWLRAFTQRQPGSRGVFKVNGRVDVV